MVEPRRSNLLVEGAITGAIGATAVAIWFLIVDTIAGRPLYTPELLGQAVFSIFGPAAGETATQHVLGYTLVHYAAFAIVGTILAAIVRRADEDPNVLAGLAMIPIFSLAGVPPLSGFIGKLVIVQGSIAAESYWVGAVILLTGRLTLLSMGRTWAEAFWRPATRPDAMPPGRALLATIGGLCLLTVGVTVGAEPLFGLASRAAGQLLQPELYINAVLGSPR